MPESANIARHLRLMASRQPNTAALKVPRGRTPSGQIDYLTLSFHELDAEVNAWVAELHARGVAPGDRVLVMVRQGLPLIAAAFALFSHGAIPIVIDPGMGLRSFLSCVKRSRPRVVLGIPVAQAISRLFRPTFKTVAVRVPASSNPLARRSRSHLAPESGGSTAEPIARKGHDLAAILFTSGSTGAPKGVCYEHGMFEAQVRLIGATYNIQPGEIDLPMLPIFALFNPALGMTTVVPEIDPSRPAAVDPAKIVQAIRQEQVTNSFGSPTLWNKIADHCIQNGTTLPSLRRVLCAGAPVPTVLWRKSRLFLPHGQLHSPYGATEALPVSSVSAEEALSILEMADASTARPQDQSDGKLGIQDSGTASSLPGTCVGRPVPEMHARIIGLSDDPITTLAHARTLAPGEIGEIIVSGPVVTEHYDNMPAADAAGKIQRADAQVPGTKFQVPSLSPDTCHLSLDTSAAEAAVTWHRMGDCGYLDTTGRLWFCGRKAERIETPQGILFTEPIEKIFREEEGVSRCALVGLGEQPHQVPALVVQPEKGANSTALADRLRHRAQSHSATRAIKHLFFHPHFPVDVRHNAKIHRLTLAKWAATQKAISL